MALETDISGLVRELGPPDLQTGAGKKNYTEAVSHRIAEHIAACL